MLHVCVSANYIYIKVSIIYIYTHIYVRFKANTNIYIYRPKLVSFILLDITFCLGSICATPISSRHSHAFLWVGRCVFVGQGYDSEQKQNKQCMF